MLSLKRKSGNARAVTRAESLDHRPIRTVENPAESGWTDR